MTQPKEHFSSYLNDLSDTPLHAEGDFLSPEYDNPVKEIHLNERPQVHSHATFYRQTVTMENGSEYLVVNTKIPEKRERAGSDIVNLETTAWTTQIEGMNMRRMHALAKLAIPTVFVSVQQNLDRRGRIDRNAHNELEIAKSFAHQYDYSDQYIIGNGISRGGMTALDVAAVAPQHAIEAIYTDSIVPCFPYGLDLRRDLPAYLKFLPNEGSTLAAIREVPFSALRHYPNTLDLSLKGIFQQLKEIPTLLSGEVGRQIQDNMSENTFAHVTAYEGDIMSQGNRWKELLDSAKYPNIVVELLNGGGHMSCVSNGCHNDWLARARTISELLHESTDNRSIGGTALRALAAERNQAFVQTHEHDNEIENYRLQKAILHN